MASRLPGFAASRPITRHYYATRNQQQKSTAEQSVKRVATVAISGNDQKRTRVSPVSTSHLSLISDLQRRLDSVADTKYKGWMDAYMRGTIPCRGVRMPQIRKAVKEWSTTHDLVCQDKKDLHEKLVEGLFHSDLSEDKISAVVLLGEILVGKKLVGLEYIPFFERMFDEGYIHSWNVTDLFCISVLHNLIRKYGEDAIKRVAEWKGCDNLWRARSSVVGLICLKKEKEYYDLIRENCTILVKREERFAKTGVGWMLREICRPDESFVLKFIEDNRNWCSLEAVKNGVKHLHADTRREYCEMVKNAQKKLND